MKSRKTLYFCILENKLKSKRIKTKIALEKVK